MEGGGIANLFSIADEKKTNENHSEIKYQIIKAYYAKYLLFLLYTKTKVRAEYKYCSIWYWWQCGIDMKRLIDELQSVQNILTSNIWGRKEKFGKGEKGVSFKIWSD